MRPTNAFLFLFFSLITSLLSAQRIDNTVSFLNVSSDKYFRFHYENDYFTATDRYYTQGINLEFVNPKLKKNPLTLTLLRFKDSPTKYGLSIEQNGYTPTSIGSDDILYNDRPFAANLMLKTFAIATDRNNSRRLSSHLSIGIIGESAYGEAQQREIHRALKNILPHGWQHQIRNDVILNYGLNYEKLVFEYKNRLFLSTNAQINLGTLSDKAAIGFTTVFGKRDNPFSFINKLNRKNFEFYVYNQILVSAIAYDATLQGGLFNRNSPYTIEAKNISRITVQDNFGVVLRFKKLYLQYDQAILTKEFSTGTFHRWGGVKIGCAL